MQWAILATAEVKNSRVDFRGAVSKVPASLRKNAMKDSIV